MQDASSVRIPDAGRMTSTFRRPSVLATVAHELRTPMTALETAAEMLLEDFDRLDEPGRRELIKTIHRRTQWMRGLVENLLCEAAFHEGALRIVPRLISLRQTVEEVTVYFEQVLAQRSQRIVITGDAMLPLIPADPQRVSQVLMNLISNANKYAVPTSTIAIDISRRAEVVHVAVSDEGPGLSPATFHRIFRAYDRAGRRDGNGFGIGLFVARSIVEAHGGRIGVENREPRGTTFWFEIPVAGSTASTHENAIEQTGDNRRRVAKVG